jgi:hypothetical protein
MTDDETPQITPEDPEIPAERPPAGSGGPELEDTPLGADPDEEVDPTDQPGIPTDGEPPASE